MIILYIYRKQINKKSEMSYSINFMLSTMKYDNTQSTRRNRQNETEMQRKHKMQTMYLQKNVTADSLQIPL